MSRKPYDSTRAARGWTPEDEGLREELRIRSFGGEQAMRASSHRQDTCREDLRMPSLQNQETVCPPGDHLLRVFRGK